MKINIKFIWHDCFVITLPKCVIITDYWHEDPGVCWQHSQIPEFIRSISPETPVYVLVSHHHKDHFNKDIFLWSAYLHNMRYIISRDTAKAIRYILKEGSTYSGQYYVNPDRVTVLDPGACYVDNLLTIRAFGSTDIGNSYLIECCGHTIFHAGDLNAWIWKDESTEAEVTAAVSLFKSKLNELIICRQEIDVAFFPVDSRIGSEWWYGAKIFVRKLKVKYFFPMHFCLANTPDQLSERISDAVTFAPYRNPEYGTYIGLSHANADVTLEF